MLGGRTGSFSVKGAYLRMRWDLPAVCEAHTCRDSWPRSPRLMSLTLVQSSPPEKPVSAEALLVAAAAGRGRMQRKCHCRERVPNGDWHLRGRHQGPGSGAAAHGHVTWGKACTSLCLSFCICRVGVITTPLPHGPQWRQRANAYRTLGVLPVGAQEVSTVIFIPCL